MKEAEPLLSATTDAGVYGYGGSNVVALTYSTGVAGDYYVDYGTGALRVAQRALTVEADALSRIYGDANPTLTYTLGALGLVNGDTLSGSLATSADQTTGLGAYFISQGSLAASANYAVTYTGANLTVNQRALTVTADALSRSYGDVNPASTYAATGLVNNDTLSGSLATNAGQFSDVGVYGITQGSLANANYAISFTGADLTVNQRALTVAADALTRTYGDANPALTYTATGLVNNDTLSGSLATTAGQFSDVGVYGVTQGTLSASSNYSLGYTGADLTVNQRALTVAADALTRTYGDANPALTYTATGLVNNDTLAGSLATTAGQSSGVGVYGITQGALSASANYDMTYSGADLTVGQRGITVTAVGKSRVYGDANPALTYTLGGFGLVNGDTLSGGLATAATTASSVGSYRITQGSLGASANYAVSYASADLTISQRAITVTADGKTRVYGDANPALTSTLGGLGLVNGDTLSGGLATAATTASNVGRYDITQGTLGASANYAVTYAGADLTVGQRGITVTADSKSRVYGDANPALTYTLGGRGLVNGDTLSGGLSTSAAPTSDVGRYTIVQGGLAASSNYAMSYTGADLSVTPRALTLTADGKSRASGDANPTLTYTVGGAGLVNGDTLTGGLATIADGNSAAGFYPITQGSLNASRNYALTYQGAMLTVTSAGAPATPAIDMSRLPSMTTLSLRETAVLPFGAAALPVPDPDAPAAVGGPTVGFVGLTDPRFEGIVVCTGGAAGACSSVPTPDAPAPRAAR